MRSAGYHEKIIGRTYFGGDEVTQFNLVLYNTIKWPYQSKHIPSFHTQINRPTDSNIHRPTCIMFFFNLPNFL